jgi:hypothetical protein
MRIFGPKRDEVTGECRKPHNEALHDLYCSPNVFRVIKSRIMRWSGHVASMGREELYAGFWLGKPNPGGDGRIVLKWIFRKWDGRHGLD